MALRADPTVGQVESQVSALAVDLRKLLRPQDPTIAPYWNLLSTQYHTRVTITSRD